MTSRTATRADVKRDHRHAAAIRKAERRRAARRRALWRKALTIAGIVTLVVVGLAVLARIAAPKDTSSEVDRDAVLAVADAPFPASDGSSVSLAQFRGAPLVLYFYEGQSCGACQTQLVDIEGALPEISSTGGKVLAVTTDPVGVSTSVAEQLQLSYPIVEDVDHALGSAMGTYLPDGHMGAADQHSVVVLSGDGTVAWRNLAGSSMYVSPGAIVSAVEAA